MAVEDANTADAEAEGQAGRRSWDAQVVRSETILCHAIPSGPEPLDRAQRSLRRRASDTCACAA